MVTRTRLNVTFIGTLPLLLEYELIFKKQSINVYFSRTKFFLYEYLTLK
jgi:hypothetical protein